MAHDAPAGGAGPGKLAIHNIGMILSGDIENPILAGDALLAENGKIVAHKRPRGRPPKHPRPTLVVEEVPIPRHYVA